MGADDQTAFAILGSLEMSRGDRVIAVGGRTPRTLLAMLLLSLNNPVRSDALAAGLWGEAPPTSALGSLHSHISRIRRLVAGGDDIRIERRPGGYALCGDPDRLDARRFERLARDGAEQAAHGSAPRAAALLREALSLWRGPALVEFADAEFARSESVRLDELRLETTAKVLDIELGLGAARELVPELERLLVEHPLQERFWAQLMVALYRDSRQADALGAYRRARTVLHEELGIEPGPALQRLERAILHHSPDLDRAMTEAPLERRSLRASTRTPPVETFVGRAAELSALADALALAAAGEGQLAVVEGAAGVGKTALLARFLEQARAAGALVCSGRAWDQPGGPPFWPWIEALRARAGSDGTPHDPMASELAELLPDWDPRGPRDPVAARIRLFRAVFQRLAGRPGGSTTVLALEDLHGADESSLELLRFFVRHIAAAPCLVVVTHRPVGLGAGLADMVADARRVLEPRALTVGPLTDVEAAGYIRQSLGADISPEIAQAVIERAEGHALFLTEIVRLLRAGANRGAGFGAQDVAEIPRSVADMIGRRYARLSEASVRLLFAASVIGREFDLRLLAQVSSLDLTQTLDLAEEAAGAGLFEELSAGALAYRFDHGLTQETLYRRLPAPRRILTHARIAAAIKSGVAGPPERQLGELARHRCASVPESGLTAAVDAAVEAAEAAMGQLAHEEAGRLYELALDTHEAHGGEASRTGSLLVTLGLARARSGRPQQARDNFLRAAELARAERDAHRLAEAALGMGSWFEARGSDPDLVALLDEAIAGVPPDRGETKVRLLACLSMALNLDDPDNRRFELSGQALAAAREVGDPALQAYCLSARYVASLGPDHLDTPASCTAEMRQLSERLSDPELELEALAWSICEFFERADRPSLDFSLRTYRQLAERSRHPLHSYQALMWRAALAALVGHPDEALDLANEAAAHGQFLTELATARRVALAWPALRDLGRLAELRPDVDRVAAAFTYIPAWIAARAWIALDLGDPEPAKELMSRPLATFDAFVSRDGNWLVGMVALAEIATAFGDAERAGRLRRALDPFAGRMMIVRRAPMCMGSIDQVLGKLAFVCGDATAAEDHFKRAIRIDQSFGARPFQARTQIEYARLLRDRDLPGDAQQARELVDSALATAEELGLPGLQEFCKRSVRR